MLEGNGQSYDTTTTQRRAFIDAMVLTSCDRPKSAIIAGYSEASAVSLGSQLYSIPWIKAEIQRRIADVHGCTDDAVIDTVAQIAFRADLADYDSLASGDTLQDLRNKGVDTKMVKTYRFNSKSGEGSVELYSRDAALDKLIRIKGLDKSAGDSTGGELVAALQALAGQAQPMQQARPALKLTSQPASDKARITADDVI